MKFLLQLCGLLLLGLVNPAGAAKEPLRVAVAANFAPTLKLLAADYLVAGGQPLIVSTGSTGKLYAQIVQGAPYDVFLAADDERPARLEADGLTVSGSRMTYAQGRLVLWHPGAGQAVTIKALGMDQGRVAIANPKLAPYGQAARSVLEGNRLWDQLQPRLVNAENVSQVLQYAMTGQVQWAFVPYSLIQSFPELPAQEILLIPADLHAPIRQQAVAIKSGHHKSALQFLDFLGSDVARRGIAEGGYDLPDE